MSSTDSVTPRPTRSSLNSYVQLDALPPLSLYIHFPWCVRKCPYCDFNSHAINKTFPEENYLAALRVDLETSLPLIWGRTVHTIFIGGGTPSLLSAAGVDKLLSDVRSLVPLDADAEITLEANPGTFEAEKFRAYHKSGINRLSIGIQSFNDVHLQALGRIHDGKQARQAIDLATACFDNFNIDLMYALPGQTKKEAQADLQQALSFSPTHLSLYHLTLEPNTLFSHRPPKLPDEDTSAEISELIDSMTCVAGYDHYEVSAYAKPHHKARHNLNYWRFGDYLGIGAGAHSKLSFPDRINRQMRYKQPAEYLKRITQGNAIQETHDIGRNALGFEFMLNALRLRHGFETRLFTERTGLPLNCLDVPLNIAEKKGLIICDYKSLRPTTLGMRFLNDLQQIFL